MNEEQIKALLAQAFSQFQTQTLPGILTGALGPIGDQLKAVADKLNTQPSPAPAPPPAPAAVPPPAPAPAPAPATTDPLMNAQLLEMRRANEAMAAQVKALNDKNVEAEKKADHAERASIIDRALGDFQFARPEARNTAVSLIEREIKRMDDGTLVAGNNLPVLDFAKDFVSNQHAYLLAPTGAGGAGVTPGSGVPGSGKPVDMNDIKPGMSDAQRQAAYAAVAAALQQPR